MKDDKKIGIYEIYSSEKGRMLHLKCLAFKSFSVCLNTGAVYKGLNGRKGEIVEDDKTLLKIKEALGDRKAKIMKEVNRIDGILNLNS